MSSKVAHVLKNCRRLTAEISRYWDHYKKYHPQLGAILERGKELGIEVKLMGFDLSANERHLHSLKDRKYHRCKMESPKGSIICHCTSCRYLDPLIEQGEKKRVELKIPVSAASEQVDELMASAQAIFNKVTTRRNR